MEGLEDLISIRKLIREEIFVRDIPSPPNYDLLYDLLQYYIEIKYYAFLHDVKNLYSIVNKLKNLIVDMCKGYNVDDILDSLARASFYYSSHDVCRDANFNYIRGDLIIYIIYKVCSIDQIRKWKNMFHNGPLNRVYIPEDLLCQLESDSNEKFIRNEICELSSFYTDV